MKQMLFKVDLFKNDALDKALTNPFNLETEHHYGDQEPKCLDHDPDTNAY
jgi:hypothetical protein